MATQYQLVFSQKEDGSSVNHANVEIPSTNSKIKREFEAKSNEVYKNLSVEIERRTQFRKEQLEFDKKQREILYKESLEILKEDEMVIESSISLLKKFYSKNS